jgi:HSP20 family protein
MLPVIIKRSLLPYHRDDFFGKDGISSLFSDGADYNLPAVNIKESENNFEIEVAAPGLGKEDFKVKLDKNILTISSAKEVNKEEEKQNFRRKEFNYRSFCRSFSVPDMVDTANIKASYKNGVLIIDLPKFEEARVKPAKEITIA